MCKETECPELQEKKPKTKRVSKEIQLPLLGMSYRLMEGGQEQTLPVETLSLIPPPHSSFSTLGKSHTPIQEGDVPVPWGGGFGLWRAVRSSGTGWTHQANFWVQQDVQEGCA